jgi:hypothetical protein
MDSLSGFSKDERRNAVDSGGRLDRDHTTNKRKGTPSRNDHYLNLWLKAGFPENGKRASKIFTDLVLAILLVRRHSFGVFG